MKDFTDIAGDIGFTSTEIRNFRELLAEKESYLTEKDSKGMLLNGIVSRLECFHASFTDFTGDTVKIGEAGEISDSEREELKKNLMGLRPWRKGPFELFGIFIDSEWKSFLKWNRLKDHISPLRGRHILDIGSSSGYYMFRMLEHNPAVVIGIEPYTNFYYQFKMLKNISGIKNILTLPLRFEELPSSAKKYNTIFCMGILYHRQSPVEFLKEIRMMMAGDGELVLETLILDGSEHVCLYPPARYSKMQNVYFIPTVPVLESWLRKAGFSEIKCADVSWTTLSEQRATEWVNTESLADFLNPSDKKRTIEGYQAPLRALLTARV